MVSIRGQADSLDANINENVSAIEEITQILESSSLLNESSVSIREASAEIVAAMSSMLDLSKDLDGVVHELRENFGKFKT